MATIGEGEAEGEEGGGKRKIMPTSASAPAFNSMLRPTSRKPIARQNAMQADRRASKRLALRCFPMAGFDLNRFVTGGDVAQQGHRGTNHLAPLVAADEEVPELGAAIFQAPGGIARDPLPREQQHRSPLSIQRAMRSVSAERHRMGCGSSCRAAG